MAGVSGHAEPDGVDARVIRSLLRAGVHDQEEEENEFGKIGLS